MSKGRLVGFPFAKAEGECSHGRRVAWIASSLSPPDGAWSGTLWASFFRAYFRLLRSLRLPSILTTRCMKLIATITPPLPISSSASRHLHSTASPSAVCSQVSSSVEYADGDKAAPPEPKYPDPPFPFVPLASPIKHPRQRRGLSQAHRNHLP